MLFSIATIIEASVKGGNIIFFKGASPSPVGSGSVGLQLEMIKF